MRLSRLIIAAALLAGLGGAASASPLASVGTAAVKPESGVELAGWRGRHYGWYRGRRAGWYGPRRYRRAYSYYRPRYYRPWRYGYYRPRYYRPWRYGYYRPRYYRPWRYGYYRPAYGYYGRYGYYRPGITISFGF